MVCIVRVPSRDTAGTRCLRRSLHGDANVLPGYRTKVRCHDGLSVHLDERYGDSRGIVRGCRRKARIRDLSGANGIAAIGGCRYQSGRHSVHERMRHWRVQEIQRIIRGRLGCQEFRRTVTVDHRMDGGGIRGIPFEQGHRNVVRNVVDSARPDPNGTTEPAMRRLQRSQGRT